MRSITKYLFIGLFALYALHQSEAQPSQVTPNCQGLPDGYKLAGKNPANFYFCQGGQAIPMFCPPGFNFCYNGLFGVCSKWCTNVTPEPTTPPPGCETTTGLPGSTDTGTQSSSIGTTTIGTTTIGTTTIGTSTIGTTTIGTSTIGTTTIGTSTIGSTTIGSVTTTATVSTDAPTTVSTQTPTPPTTVPTTTAIAGSTTPAPPNPETVCSKFGVGSIFSIQGDCSAFGICIFGKVVIGRCLGNRGFDPFRGVCTVAKCTN